MTTPNLISDLKQDEGCRLVSYPDPLSKGEPWTIGYGSTGAGIGPNTRFKLALAAMQVSDWDEAAVQMLDSEWAAEVPNRAKRLANQMRIGESLSA